MCSFLRGSSEYLKPCNETRAVLHLSRRLLQIETVSNSSDAVGEAPCGLGPKALDCPAVAAEALGRKKGKLERKRLRKRRRKTQAFMGAEYGISEDSSTA
jgi:hypothetical protein